MLIDSLPEVQRLSDTEKFQLASELWDQLSTSDTIEPDPAIVRLLEQRYSDFKAGSHPSSSWDELKKRIGKL